MKKGLFLLLCMVSLCTASVSLCRADASPPTKESSINLTATVPNAEIYAPFEVVATAAIFEITNDAENTSFIGVWDTPATQNSYAMAGRVPYLSWRQITILSTNNKGKEIGSIIPAKKPFIYMISAATNYIQGAA